MSTWPGLSEVSPDCVAVVEEFVRPLPEAELLVLRVQLQVLQRRHGTVDEPPCDAERIQALRHEINHRFDDGLAPLPV